MQDGVVLCCRVQTTDTDAMAYNNRGGAYARKGDYDQAITELNEVIRLDPANTDARSILQLLTYIRKSMV